MSEDAKDVAEHYQLGHRINVVCTTKCYNNSSLTLAHPQVATSIKFAPKKAVYEQLSTLKKKQQLDTLQDAYM